MSTPIFDVFQPGLRRGAERLPFAPHKRYFYVEHPTEGWKVFLRACTFIHDATNPDPNKFIVVKRYHSRPSAKSWEPPKGQMEGKDGLAHPSWPILDILVENVHREVQEESKIKKVDKLQYTGLVLQGVEVDYKPNTYFQYHVFRGVVQPAVVEEALEEFEWLNDHPKAFARMRKDVREKDALSWFDPRKTKMMGKWSPSLLVMYLKEYARR
jgi:8-oxo-dGTP pyrophosphatase MutT (NUDIX family)